MSEIVTAEWILKASKEEILKNRDLVLKYLKIKESNLASINNAKAWERCYQTYVLVLSKVLECGIKWKRKF